jgi:large subunit ribosomal protein L10
MNRAEKEAEIAFLREALAGAEGVVLASLKGLTMAEVSDLRRKAHAAGVKVRVAKNTLAKKAFEGTGLSVLAGDFKEETAIVFSDDPVAPAKVVSTFKSNVEKFRIKAGYNAGQRLDAAGVDALSKLPSLDELRAQILGVIQGVSAKLLAQVNAPAQHVIGVIQAKADKDKEAA